MGVLEDHLAASQRAFAARDAQTGLRELSLAFAIDPFDTPALQLAYSVMPQIPNVVELTKLTNQTPPAMVAMHAMALGLSHQWSRAIDLLFRLGANEPQPYLMWAEQWMGTHPSAQLLDLGVVGPSIARFGDSFEDPIDPSDKRHENLTAGIAVVKKLSEVMAQNQGLRVMHAKLLRRAKRFDEALALAAQTKQRDAHFGTMMTAWCLRDMDRMPEAIGAFHEAYRIQPDHDVLLDIGDIHLDRGELEQAIEAYRMVPPNAERASWALPSALCAQYLLTRDPALDAQLRSLADQKNDRALGLWELVHAYAEHQPLPRDLTAGIVRDVQAMFRDKPTGTPQQPAKLDVNISSIESPSVSLAFQLAATMGRSHAVLNVTAEKEARPDPRLPLMQAIGRGPDGMYQAFPIWVYESTRARVNAPPPPPDAVAAISRVVSAPFDWSAWSRLAPEIGPTFRGKSNGLVAALVHPAPPADPTRDAIEHVARWQLAIALLLLRLDEGWGTSERRGGLLAMVHGPLDWLHSAALPALGIVYAETPESRGELQQIFAALRQRIPDIGYAPYRAALEAVTMRLPDISEPDRRAAWARLTKATRKPYLG